MQHGLEEKKEEASLSTLPHDFFDPIAHEKMLDPVVSLSGCSYEREEVYKWIAACAHPEAKVKAIDVIDNQIILTKKTLVDNHALKHAIEEFEAGGYISLVKLYQEKALTKIAEYKACLEEKDPQKFLEAARKADWPFGLICPLSFKFFTRPVCTPSGITYEEEDLVSALEKKEVDPLTQAPLSSRQKLPLNRNLWNTLKVFNTTWKMDDAFKAHLETIKELLSKIYPPLLEAEKKAEAQAQEVAIRLAAEEQAAIRIALQAAAAARRVEQKEAQRRCVKYGVGAATVIVVTGYAMSILASVLLEQKNERAWEMAGNTGEMVASTSRIVGHELFKPLALAVLSKVSELVRYGASFFPSDLSPRVESSLTRCKASDESFCIDLINLMLDNEQVDSLRELFQDGVIPVSSFDTYVGHAITHNKTRTVAFFRKADPAILKINPHFLPMAAKSNATMILKMLVEQGVSVKTFYDDFTALHYAASSNDVPTMRLLLEKGADINAMSSSSNKTALHQAIESRQHDAAQFLFEQGARVSLALAQKTLMQCMSAYFWRHENNMPFIKILLKLKVDVKEAFHNFPLIHENDLWTDKHIELATLLLDAGLPITRTLLSHVLLGNILNNPTNETIALLVHRGAYIGLEDIARIAEMSFSHQWPLAAERLQALLKGIATRENITTVLEMLHTSSANHIKDKLRPPQVGVMAVLINSGFQLARHSSITTSEAIILKVIHSLNLLKVLPMKNGSDLRQQGLKSLMDFAAQKNMPMALNKAKALYEAPVTCKLSDYPGFHAEKEKIETDMCEVKPTRRA